MQDGSRLAEVSADASVSMNGDSTTSESEYTLAGGRRVSIGMGVEIGTPRRRSSGSRGQRPERAGSRERVTVPVLLNGKWDDSMEKALEDILEARVSPEASEASEELSEDDVMAEEDDVVNDGDDVLGEEDVVGEGDDLLEKVEDLLREDADVVGNGEDVMAEGDDDMPVLEDGAQQGESKLSEGAGELGLEEAEGGPEDGSRAEEEAAILHAGGESSKLNDLLEENANTESAGGNQKERGLGNARPEGLKLPAESGDGTGSGVELGRSSLADDERVQSGLTSESVSAVPRRSQSLDSTKGTASNGVNRPDEAGGPGAASEEGGSNANDASGGESPRGGGYRSGGESPHTGVYSRFLTRGFARSGSSSSLSENTPEKQSVNKHPQDGTEAGASGGPTKESRKGEVFQDAMDTLTPTVSDASMQEALEDNDWLEVPRVGREGGSTQERNGETEGEDGNEDEDGQGSSLLGPLLGGLRRRGRTKQDT